MTIGENIGEFWTDLSGMQKFGIAAVGVILGLMLGYGIITSIWSGFEIRQLEREVNNAKLEAAEALAQTVEIAKEKKLVELKLVEVEAKRNAKQPELDKAVREASDARAEYERAVREPRRDNPSTDQLCAELADLGISCRR
jgi:hypothetical protein